ncbi:MAG TPA: DNA methyltransferase [Rhizomicrobium sp.]|jgi:DNA modification methylase|nr:DNA methyltransferase [Rhizomicrobium sp.]
MSDVAKKKAAASNAKHAGACSPKRTARAELVWDGKYDEAGRRVAPLRVALPFQTVETVNESAQERQKSLLLGAGFAEEEWRNRLVWGDKKYVLPSLLPEFAGKVNLIYIDPPFDTGADFSFTATVPDDPDNAEDDSFTFEKEPSIIEQKAYRDTWGRGLQSYLQWFYETSIFLSELLHESGAIYVHVGWQVASAVKMLLDENFGEENFRNELIWKRTSSHNFKSKGFVRATETIWYYTKSDSYTFNEQYGAYSEEQLSRYRPDESGRLYKAENLTFSTKNPSRQFEWRGTKPPPNRSWGASKEQLEAWWSEGRILKKRDGAPRLDGLKFYLDEMKGPALSNFWDDIGRVGNTASERLDYPTQKPEALLERVVKASSNEGDLVLDCFCGSGTTAAVAEKLGRRWIACDLGRFAIHTTRKRLLSVPNVRPFIVQNLGKYERQVWAGTEFGANEKTVEQQRAYIEFILNLANATPIHGYTWLHGVKAGRMVHVGAVDAPVSTGDITQIAAEFKRAIGTGDNAPKTNGVDVLGWDFAFEMNEVARQQAAAANIQMRFLRIPRDVMDKRAVEQGDIKFFELAALAVDVKTNKHNVHLKLTDFVIPPDDVPEEARKAVKHWSQWIDYWAVDWDNRSDTFHNEWQAYRTRKDKTLQLEIAHTYAEAGDYTIVVKVIDILGNDTTKSVRVSV